VFETLVTCKETATGTRYQPGLATRWAVEQGGRALALELRGEVRFHDGSRLGPGDVQFSLDAARAARTGDEASRALLADVASVELSARGVRIWLVRPSGYALRALCSVPMLPAAIYQDRGRAAGAIVGSGPYRVATGAGASVRLERNPDYWGPAPAIGAIVFVREADDARALSLARAGEIDVIPALIPVHVEHGDEPGMVRRFAPLAAARAGFEYLALATDRPPLDDVRVRRAISLAIDRAELARRARGLVRPISAPVWPGGPASGPAPPVPAIDRAQAIRLLEEAGWSDRDRDGMRERGGNRLHLVALIGDRPSPVRDAVLAALRGLGFFVEERVGSPAVLLNRLRDGQFQLAFVRWRGPSDGDLAGLLGARGRQSFGNGGSREIDRLLDAMRAAGDPAERFRLAGELGARIAESVPLIPLLAEAPRGLVHRRVRGVRVWDGWLALAELSLAPEVGAE
jgi:peptide/nickel transport system substrate-binding protein